LEFRIHHSQPDSAHRLGAELLKIAHMLEFRRYEETLLLCIGTDRSTGDSLGPLVGTALGDNRAHVGVWGTLDEPVHAGNLHQYSEQISSAGNRYFIIAVDACLGKSCDVGTIRLSPGPLKPGAGVNKSLPEVGHVSLTGTVNIGGFMEYYVLQNTRLSLVVGLAKTIVAALEHCLWQLELTGRCRETLIEGTVAPGSRADAHGLVAGGKSAAASLLSPTISRSRANARPGDERLPAESFLSRL